MNPEVFWKNVQQRSPFIRAADIATITGVHRGTIGRMISANRAPKLWQATRIAEALNCTVDELLYEREEVKA